MTRREELYDQCENAIFALLMEDFMEEEGRRLLEINEALKDDPEAVVPDISYRKGIKTIRRSFGVQRRRSAGRTAYRVFNKVAVIALIDVLLLTTAFAASPTLRREALKFIVSITEDTAELQITASNDTHASGTNTSNIYTLDDFILPSLPEGFELTKQQVNGQGSVTWFEDESGNSIMFGTTAGQNTDFGVDTEDAETIEKVQVHGYDGILVVKGNTVNIVYGDTDRDIFIHLYCVGLDRETAYALIDGITYKKD